MRFTLRALLLLTATLGFLAAVCFAFPVWLANLVMAPVPLILPGVYTVGLIYGPKASRPFYIGALVPFVADVFSYADVSRYSLDIYAGVMARLYERIGQPRPIQEDLVIELSEPIYMPISITLVVSIVSGFVCLGCWAAFWKDRAEQER